MYVVVQTFAQCAYASGISSQISPEEQKKIVDGFTHTDQTQASGLRIAGNKYFAISVDSRTIQLKKGVRPMNI